jgi:hypothetical protein
MFKKMLAPVIGVLALMISLAVLSALVYGIAYLESLGSGMTIGQQIPVVLLQLIGLLLLCVIFASFGLLMSVFWAYARELGMGVLEYHEKKAPA